MNSMILLKYPQRVNPWLKIFFQAIYYLEQEFTVIEPLFFQIELRFSVVTNVYFKETGALMEIPIPYPNLAGYVLELL